MDFLDECHPQPQQRHGQEALQSSEQHTPHQSQQDAGSLFGEVASPTQAAAAKTAAGAPEAAQPVYVPPVVPQAANTEDFWSDDRASPASPLQTETNGRGVTEAVQKEIEKRTQNIDAESKKKAEAQKVAAESYMKQVKAQHEARLKETKAENMRQQKANEAKRNEFKKSGAVWNGVGLMTDLSKANVYSKSTERMRNILRKLNDTAEGETLQS
ncbi:uncharacterized protein Tco025E_04449 [Trypanosoma conorhini]|uniref:Clathrin light chain n=1 Tax=Trypanosoma conorhini TaxID=83891 RepID=A0A3R7NAD9_9TRYP|nr:uncharacterized protein Tco025E_04449 [Trypanosoma conorhini]RNF19022.1 hypothetical protein Tco025E_04449 [Trypanosoma conorhini]